MDRIVIHWTAGTHRANATDRRHYHYIVEGDGAVVAGDHPPEANARGPLVSGSYAAHTASLNTGSVGVALAAMHGAREMPFDTGKHPITPTQIEALARLCADLCRRYGIPVTRRTVLTHAEVQPTLGVKQAGKIDIMWLPGMTQMGDPIEVGDRLRDLIRKSLDFDQAASPHSAGSAQSKRGISAVIGAVISLLSRMFSR